MKKKVNKKEPVPLKIRKNAPPLKGIDWLHGEKVTFGKGLTVVKFWAAWCGPSHEYLGTMTDLQKKHENRITFAALSAEETEDVEPFLEKKKKKIEYSVGCAPARLYQAYLNGIKGIPHCFIVDEEGLLVWHGHPSELEKTLELIFDTERSLGDLIKAFIKKEKFLELFNEIKNGSLEKLNRKSKMKNLAREYLEMFPDDQDALEILENYPILLPGEKYADLGEISWLKDSAEIGTGYSLIDFWDLENGESLNTFPHISAVHKKFKNKITVIGLTKNSAPSEEISEFLERHTDDISYPVGAVSEEVYKICLPDEDAWQGCTALLNSENVLLWSGKAAHAHFIISHLLEKNGTEKDILDHCSDRAMFLQMDEEFSADYDPVSEQSFDKLLKLGERVLSINPADTEILTILSIYAKDLGYEAMQSVCGLADISYLNNEQVLSLLSDLQMGSKDVHPFEFILRSLESVLKTDPSVSNILYYGDILKSLHKLDMALEYYEKALECNEQTEDIERKKAEILNMKNAADFAKKISQILP
ncbi:MAG TPA: thioredoxin domain-containing protein [Leptospiraceae bacterium]|nr:thioredoxin domain-containing protein [Leptospiraceae bacterium]